MAYVLGFFAADGNLSKNRNGGCYFSLEIRDKDILEKIRTVMNANQKISMRPARNNGNVQYRLQIGSKEIYNDLQNLGFAGNKTHNMCVPNVLDEYFADFLRGYFDGDGNIWSGIVHRKRKKQSLSLLTAFTSASKAFLENIFSRLAQMVTNGGSFIDYGTFYRISYSTQDSLRIYDFMYNRPYCNLYLSRKSLVFDRFIAMRL